MPLAARVILAFLCFYSGMTIYAFSDWKCFLWSMIGDSDADMDDDDDDDADEDDADS